MMEMIIMTNGQIGISSFERNGNLSRNHSWKSCSSCGFLNSWRPPIFGVGLDKSGRKMRVCGMRVKALAKEVSDDRLVGGGVIEKEFEFKPSFGEYLKAMESVKSGKGKQQVNNSYRHKVEDDSIGSDASSSGRDGRSVKSRRFNNKKRVSKVRGNDFFRNNDDEINGQEDAINVELCYTEKRTREFNSTVGGKECNADANGKRKTGGATTDGQLLREHIGGMNSLSKDFNGVASEKTRNIQESPMVLNDIQSSVGTISIKEKLGHGKDSLEMLKKEGKVFKIGVGGNKIDDRVVRNHIQVDRITDKGMVQKKESSSRNNKAFLESSGDAGFEVARAAFKSFEQSDGALTKQLVPMREIEEKIQRLGNWLNGADIDMPEWMFSKAMRSARIKYTDHSILRVIQILGKLGNWRRVLQVLEWLKIRERYKSHRLRHVYTTALHVLGKAKRPVEALNVFRAMQQELSLYPDIVAYRSLAVTLGQAGYMRELFDVIDSMQSPPKQKFKTGILEKWDPRLEPDVVVYNAVLNACVRRKQWEGAFWVLQQLKEQGEQPSTSTYGLIMEVMLECGKYNLVHEFFRKVQKSSIPNALVYKVLVNAFWREGKTDKAVLAVKDMERRGIVGSAALYYDLARCLCSAGRCQEGLMQIEKICKVANKPLVVTYTGLIQTCLDSGNIQNARYIFNEMQRFCTPNLVTCNIMLKAYLEHGFFEEATKLFHKMSEDGNHINRKSDYKVRVIPDIYTFNTMLNACIAEKRWDDFEYIYKRMLHHGFHFNANRHLQMILEASRAGKGEAVEITWKHLTKEERLPPPALVKARFCMMLEKDDFDSALACITTNSTGELQGFSKIALLSLFEDNAQRFRKDALTRLMHEVRMLLARSNSPNPQLQNLLTACSDYNRANHVKVPQTNQTESLFLTTN